MACTAGPRPTWLGAGRSTPVYERPMASEGTTVVLGIPIPSIDPVFLAIVGVHVLFGIAAVIAGAVAMLSRKGRGRHSNFGTIYFWCLFGVFVTMSALSFMRWAENVPPVRPGSGFFCRRISRAQLPPGGIGGNGPGCISPAWVRPISSCLPRSTWTTARTCHCGRSFRKLRSGCCRPRSEYR